MIHEYRRTCCRSFSSPRSGFKWNFSYSYRVTLRTSKTFFRQKSFSATSWFTRAVSVGVLFTTNSSSPVGTKLGGLDTEAFDLTSLGGSVRVQWRETTPPSMFEQDDLVTRCLFCFSGIFCFHLNYFGRHFKQNTTKSRKVKIKILKQKMSLLLCCLSTINACLLDLFPLVSLSQGSEGTF